MGSIVTLKIDPPVNIAYSKYGQRTQQPGQSKSEHHTAVMWHISCQPIVISLSGLIRFLAAGMFHSAKITTVYTTI